MFGTDALAQDTGPLEPLGIRAGAFLIYPSLAISGSFDDNVFATDDNEDDDYFMTISPSVRAESQWSRHALRVTAKADTGLYLDDTDNNFFDYGIEAAGRLDVMRGSALQIRTELGRTHQARSDPDDTGQDDVTKYIRGVLDLSYRHNFNRVFIQPGVSFQRFDYEDVGATNNDDRDILRTGTRLRVGYAVSPRISVFGQGDYAFTDYDETPDDNGIDRESDSYGGSIGAEIDLTGILTGEVSIGYREQDYDDGTLDDFSGVGAEANLTWEVTQLTTIVGSLVGENRETTVIVNGDPASSIFGVTAGVDVTHELRRNILLNGNVAYQRDDFEGTNRTDDSFFVGAGARYLVNRNLAVDASYNFSTRTSDDDDQDYTRSVFRVGVVIQL